MRDPLRRYYGRGDPHFVPLVVAMEQLVALPGERELIPIDAAEPNTR